MSEEPQSESTSQSFTPPTQNWSQQIIGALVGGVLTYLILKILMRLGWQPGNPQSLILLGAAAGGIFNDIERFDQAGARITKRASEGNPWMRLLNVAIAFIIAAIFFFTIMGLIALVASLLGVKNV